MKQISDREKRSIGCTRPISYMAEYLHQKMVRFLYRKRTAHITLDGKQGTEENLNVKKLEIVPADLIQPVNIEES